MNSPHTWFALVEFDMWFTQYLASGIFPWSFFVAYSSLFCILLLCLFFAHIMIAVIFVVLLILLFPIFFPGQYASELLISFLPYIAWIACIFTIISFVHFKKRMKPWYHSTRRYFRGISFLAFCFLFFWYSKQFNHFYITEPFIQQQTTWTLKILFANIHKNNTAYEEIKKIITDTDPDMLMFVEFADHHYTNLKDLLQKKYPYTNNTTRSKTFIGSMVFSKYPLNNKADDFLQWARRYGYFSLPYKNQQIYFYLVHTSSPDSYDHFLMRNEQLTTFVENFKVHESNRKHDTIVAVGDFNITPWSPYYAILDDAFSGQLTNTTTRIPFLFTRKFKQLPLFQAHIDHLWTTPSLIVQTLDVVTIPGSDHKSFLFTLGLK